MRQFKSLLKLNFKSIPKGREDLLAQEFESGEDAVDFLSFVTVAAHSEVLSGLKKKAYKAIEDMGKGKKFVIGNRTITAVMGDTPEEVKVGKKSAEYQSMEAALDDNLDSIKQYEKNIADWKKQIDVLKEENKELRQEMRTDPNTKFTIIQPAVKNDYVKHYKIAQA